MGAIGQGRDDTFCIELIGLFIAWGDFGLGGFWLGGILTRGISSGGILAWRDFVLGGFCPGGFCLGGIIPGGFCPITIPERHTREATQIVCGRNK